MPIENSMNNLGVNSKWVGVKLDVPDMGYRFPEEITWYLNRGGISRPVEFITWYTRKERKMMLMEYMKFLRNEGRQILLKSSK